MDRIDKMTSTILAFDIGIKNLAYCIVENGNQIRAWENVNLIPSPEPIHCVTCKRLKATFEVKQTPYCKRHIPKTHTILPELSKKKFPPNKVLKELVKMHECTSNGTTNEKCIEALSQKFALPLQQPKEENASRMSLESIHDALRQFVQSRWQYFSGCTHVLLENQPVFKNPHMKSVQVLLFAVLRENFLQHQQTPDYHFVHAKKKVSDAEKGDAGYAERKSKSEQRVVDSFAEGIIHSTPYYEEWKKMKKKSDMADALCMCMDYSMV